jgi:hypothetical protein
VVDGLVEGREGAAKLDWALPAKSSSNAPITGTETRYPPPNMWNGPQSCGTNPGFECAMTPERHVYQAGSRVGAVSVGSFTNCHPKMTSSTPMATTKIQM